MTKWLTPAGKADLVLCLKHVGLLLVLAYVLTMWVGLYRFWTTASGGTFMRTALYVTTVAVYAAAVATDDGRRRPRVRLGVTAWSCLAVVLLILSL